MYATERQDLIARAVRERGRVAVRDLAERFGTTSETARRDLAALERRGIVRRVHGGAVSPDRASLVEEGVAERAGRAVDAKRMIGARAAQAIPEGFDGSMLLDAGTTTGALIAPLVDRLAGARVEIVTNAVAHAAALAGRAGLGLSVVGGRVRSVTGAAVGSGAVRALEQMRPDVAFVGANGVSASFGLSTPDPEEAAVKRAMVRSARRVVVLADATKFDVESLHAFASLDEIDVLVTDAVPSGDLAEALARADVDVWTGV